MIDTIILTLTNDMFSISDPEKFQPYAYWALDHTAKNYGIQSKQNPTKKELRVGIYKPRLTLSHRISQRNVREITLKIELSLPKLLFGNNFDELQLKDFPLIIEKLVAVLYDMGVIVDSVALECASVMGIHYSKNMLFTDGTIPYHFINKIKEAQIKLSLDVNQTDYRNDGHSYKWHCNSYEVIFYDKIRDLEKAKISEKRALEKDNAMQLKLFTALQKRKKLEVLRMEVRLNKREKIRHLCTLLGIKTDLTFRSLFKPSNARKVLLYYLDELESKRPLLLDYKAQNNKALLAALMCNNPELSPKRIMELYGFKQALEMFTIRELRGMFANHTTRSWYRLMADVKKVKMPTKQSSFDVLREHLVTFKAVRVKIMDVE